MRSLLIVSIVCLLALPSLGALTVIDFEDAPIGPDSAWFGGFSSGGAQFPSSVTNWGGGFMTWQGWAASSKIDNVTPGFVNEFSAITGGGHNSSNYAVGYYSDWPSDSPAVVDFGVATHIPMSVMVTNTTYTYRAIHDGDDGNVVPFAKKFGGESGQDPDWLLLTIVGKNGGQETERVEFYLADFRSSEKYVIDSWTEVDLSVLGLVTSIEFSVTSSDWGTPTYFAMDNLTIVPEPTVISLLGIGATALLRRRGKNG